MPCSRTCAVKKDVNDGYRTGVRGVGQDRAERQPDRSRRASSTSGSRPTAGTASTSSTSSPIRSRPRGRAVTLGEREQFTQLEEPFTDEFVLGDLNIDYNFGDGLHHVDHVVHLSRRRWSISDATALTASITGGTIGLPERRLHAQRAADDATNGEGVDAGAALVRRHEDGCPWWPAASSATRTATTARRLPVTGFEDCCRASRRTGLRAPKDTLFFSDLGYKLNQFALFGEGTLSVTDQLELTGGLRYYHFNEDKRAGVRRHLRQRQHRHDARVAARLHRRQRRGAAGHRQLQADRITRT